MRKNIIFSCILASMLIILGQFNFFEALMLFFLAGIIPGTHYRIPSNLMFFLIIACISLVITWLLSSRLIGFFHERLLPSNKTKDHLPKRRFSEI